MSVMFSVTVNIALFAALLGLVNTQFGFPFFGNQQQSNPFGQTGFQPANQNFGTFPNYFQQQNFAYPGYQTTENVQQNYHHQQNNQNHRPSTHGNQHPQNHYTTQRPTSIYTSTYKPSSQQAQSTRSTLPPFRIDERISKTKCTEYANLIRKKVVVASLSLDSSAQDVAVVECDAVTGLVVGGENAEPNEFPHQVAIGYPDLNQEISFKCGGSLISDRFVLTAAHCKRADRTSPTTVRLGDLNLKLKDKDLPEIDILIDSFIAHEDYNKDTKQNDIAVIKMKQSAPLSKSIRPACLQQSENIGKTKAVATGWGYTTVAGSTSDILQKVQLDLINNQQCLDIYEGDENYLISRSQICAGVLKGGKDTCGGDSGGPLQITTENECIFSIIGVTSYGSTYCGSRNSPGVYTRVSSYLDWIETKVWG